MVEPALLILGTRDTGGRVVRYFGIAAGREREAGAELLGNLREGTEVWLRNDLDEGGEGCTCFRRVRSGYETETFGHGWSSGWKPTDAAGVLAAVAELADLNRGRNEWERGSIQVAKG